MKNGKDVRPDGIPAEAWKALGEEGIDFLFIYLFIFIFYIKK